MDNKERMKIEIGEGKKRVKIEKDSYGMHLLIMNNGFQWGGVPVDDEILDMIIDVINNYKYGRGN